MWNICLQETIVIEETDNLDSNEDKTDESNKVTTTWKPEEEEEEDKLEVDYHVIKVDNKPVLIDKLSEDLKRTNKTKTPPSILQEEETLLNIS